MPLLGPGRQASQRSPTGWCNRQFGLVGNAMSVLHAIGLLDEVSDFVAFLKCI